MRSVREFVSCFRAGRSALPFLLLVILSLIFSVLCRPDSAVAAGNAVASFRISGFDSKQQVNEPFRITLEAMDSEGNVVGTFNQKIQLLTSAPGVVVIPQDEKGVILSGGEWSGYVTIREPAEDISLAARYGDVYSESNLFDVLSDNPRQMYGALVVTVMGAHQIPVPDATVVLNRTSQPDLSFTTKTDSSGEGVFEHLPLGAYSVRAFSGQASSTVCDILVESGQCFTQDIMLDNGKKPLLIVPGVLGSTLVSSDDWYPVLPDQVPLESELKPLDPTIWGVYRPVGLEGFKEFFEDSFDVQYVPYDWRMDVNTSWRLYLKKKIDEVKKATGYDKVDIIAHSMGGLVTRAYIESPSYGNDIDKFVMLGTPNGGSANTYFMAEGGNPGVADDLTCTSRIQCASFPLYTKATENAYEAIKGRGTFGIDGKDEKKLIEFYSTSAPSLRELFPLYDFLDVRGAAGNPQPFSAYETSNVTLADLNSDPDKYRMAYNPEDSGNAYCVNNPSCVETRLLLSNSEDTIADINVLPPENPPADVYPSGAIYDPPGPVGVTVDEKAGDGTVMADTAEEPFDYAAPGFTIEKDYGYHASMFKSKAAKEDIYEFLTGRFKSAETLPPSLPESLSRVIVSLYINGGVQPLLVDPSGRTEGVNHDTGELEKNITGARIALVPDLSAIHIDNPADGDYTVSLEGPAATSFTARLEYSDPKGRINLSRKVYGLYHGGILSFRFHINTGSADPADFIDPVAGPAGIRAVDRNGMTSLSWQAVPDVSRYRIYGRPESQPDFVLLGRVTGTSFDTGQAWNTDGTGIARYFVVTAISSEGKESFFTGLAENRADLIADYGADRLVGAPGVTINFTDLSEGGPTSWAWDFDGDGVIDSTVRNPSFTYKTAGKYNVTLKVFKGDDSDTETRVGYITVGLRGPKSNNPGINRADYCPYASTSGDGMPIFPAGSSRECGGLLTAMPVTTGHLR